MNELSRQHWQSDCCGTELFGGAVVEISGSNTKSHDGFYVILRLPNENINCYHLKRVKKANEEFVFSAAKYTGLSWGKHEYEENHAQIKIIGTMSHYKEKYELISRKHEFEHREANIKKLEGQIARWHKTRDRSLLADLVHIQERLAREIAELEAIIG